MAYLSVHGLLNFVHITTVISDQQYLFSRQINCKNYLPFLCSYDYRQSHMTISGKIICVVSFNRGRSFGFRKKPKRCTRLRDMREFRQAIEQKSHTKSIRVSLRAVECILSICSSMNQAHCLQIYFFLSFFPHGHARETAREASLTQDPGKKGNPTSRVPSSALRTSRVIARR